MVILDGIEYTINTAEENAQSMLTAINTWCNDNNVTNRDGDIIQIEANIANPLYIMLYGIGFLASMLQNLIYSAGCCLSLTSSSDRQLLDIADVAGVRRKDPSYTSILATVYSNLADDEGAVPCQITTDLTATVSVNGQTVIFSPAYDVMVPVGSSRTIVLVAQSLGSFELSTNFITSFDTNPEGFRTMATSASVPGQDQESITALRQRIQERVSSGTMLEQAIEAIEQLPGVTACNIYFNRSVYENELIDSIEVPPRHALLFVQGFSSDIAKAYYTYMIAETTRGDVNNTLTQTYTTASGQELPIYIITPKEVPVYVRVYFNSVVDDVTSQQMKDTIAQLAIGRTIGQVLTSTDIIDILQENFLSYNPAGAQLSFDGGDYRYQVQPGVNELAVFNNANIEIIGAQ